MLSYKLKHLCSRVIASLSAVGLFSVNAGVAQAATYTYQPGDSFKAYNYAANTTFSANMTEMTAEDYCLTGSNVRNVARVTFNGGSCEYECSSGFAFMQATIAASGLVQTTITGDITPQGGGIYQAYTLTDSCDWGASGFCYTNNAEGTGMFIESATYISGEDPKCEYTCMSGYHAPRTTPTGVCADGETKGCGDGDTVWYDQTGEAGDIYPRYACVPNKYVVKYDCGFATISGTSNSSMSQDVTFMVGFSIPEEAVCEAQGYTFEGWNSDKSFNKTTK